MSTRLVTFNAQNVTPQDDALLYEKAVPGAGIIYGCDLSHAGSNTIHISTGFGIVDGRFFEVVEDTITVPLSSSGTIQGRVIGRLDLSNTGDPFVIIAQTAPLSPLRVDSDVNIFNGTHEFLLANFEIDELTIKNFQDVKPGVGIDLSQKQDKLTAGSNITISGTNEIAVTSSPAFTGTPTTPNISDLTTSTSQIANTKFVQDVVEENKWKSPYVKSRWDKIKASQTIAANGIVTVTSSPINETGFSLVGVVGHNVVSPSGATGGPSVIMGRNFGFDRNAKTVMIALRNISSSAATVDVNVATLWFRTDPLV